MFKGIKKTHLIALGILVVIGVAVFLINKSGQVSVTKPLSEAALPPRLTIKMEAVRLLPNGSWDASSRTEGPLSVSQEKFVILWSTTPTATYCVASGGWSGQRPPSNSGGVVFGPISSDTTYKLSCSLKGSTLVTDSILVKANLISPMPPPTISVSSTPIAQNVVAGIQQFTFANYNVGTGNVSALFSVLPALLSSSGSPTNLSNCKLYKDKGTTLLTSGANVVNPTRTGNNEFRLDTPLTIQVGTSVYVSLKCDVSNRTPSGTTYAWGFAGNPGQTMTVVSSGTLSVSVDSGSDGSLLYRLVSPGQTVELIKIKFSAANENISVRQVALQLSRTNLNSPVDLVDQRVTLWDGVTQVGEAFFAAGDNAVGTLSNFVVANGSSKILTVKGMIANISASGPLTASGDWLTVDYDGNNVGMSGTYGVGIMSGQIIIPTGADTASNGVRLMKAHPKLQYVPLSFTERILVNGDNRTLYKFKVAASNGDVALYQQVFGVRHLTSSNLILSNVRLSAYTDSAYSVLDPNFSNCLNGSIHQGNFDGAIAMQANCTGEVVFSSTFEIPQGETRWFKLEGSIANIAPSGTADAIQIRLLGDTAYPVLPTTMGQRLQVAQGAYNEFIWSPLSTTSASQFNLDWTNGYRVDGLPSGSMTPETISK